MKAVSLQQLPWQLEAFVILPNLQDSSHIQYVHQHTYKQMVFIKYS